MEAYPGTNAASRAEVFAAQSFEENEELLQDQVLQGNYDEMVGVAAPVEHVEVAVRDQVLQSSSEGVAQVGEGRTFQDFQEELFLKNSSEGVVEKGEEGLLARVGGRIGEFAREHMPRKLTVGLAAAAVAVGGAVETSNQTTEKAEAANTTRTLGHNALKKICVKEGLKKPVLRRGDLNRQREKQVRMQGWDIREAVWLLPSECNGEFKRLTYVKSEVRNPGQRWRTSLRWGLAIATNKGVLGDKNDPNSNVGEYNNTIDAIQSLNVSLGGPGATYKCGGRARVKMKNRVKDLDTGKFVAGRQWKYAAKVKPTC